MLLAIPVILDSCFSDPGTDIKLSSGGSVEINEATTSAGLDITKTYSKAAATVKDSLRVNLVGPQRASNTNVAFTIDAASTAVVGTHYNLVSQNTIVIPSNKSFGFIYFNVLSQNINSGETWKMKVVLSSSDVPVSVNYGKFTRSMKAN